MTFLCWPKMAQISQSSIDIYVFLFFLVQSPGRRCYNNHDELVNSGLFVLYSKWSVIDLGIVQPPSLDQEEHSFKASLSWNK